MDEQNRSYFDQTRESSPEEPKVDNMVYPKPYNADNQFNINARGKARPVVNVTPGTIKVFKVESTS